MKNAHTTAWAALPLALGLSAPASAIVINFDYSYDTGSFFSDPTRKSVLEAAGGFFESVLLDDLTAITSGGGNSFDAIFTNPADGTQATINDFSVAADTLTIFVGGRSLGGSTLGFGGPGGFSVSGSTDFVNNAVSRGEIGDTQGSTATEFAPWGGAITFDSDASWYFDSDPSTDEPFTGNDFFSVALHELGHVLGIGTADSWDAQVDSTNLLFFGATASTLWEGPVPLENTGHWKEGLTGVVNGSSQEVAMDPTLTVGTRKLFTNLDLAGLDDIGWDVKPVPLPGAFWLFGSGLVALAGLDRRRRQG